MNEPLVIVLEGGVVGGCFTRSGTEFGHPIVVIDYDEEGSDDERIRDVPQGDGTTSRGYVSHPYFAALEPHIVEFVDEWLKEEPDDHSA